MKKQLTTPELWAATQPKTSMVKICPRKVLFENVVETALCVVGAASCRDKPVIVVGHNRGKMPLLRNGSVLAQPRSTHLRETEEIARKLISGSQVLL